MIYKDNGSFYLMPLSNWKEYPILPLAITLKDGVATYCITQLVHLSEKPKF